MSLNKKRLSRDVDSDARKLLWSLIGKKKKKVELRDSNFSACYMKSPEGFAVFPEGDSFLVAAGLR